MSKCSACGKDFESDANPLARGGYMFCEECSNSNALQRFFEKKIRKAHSWEERKRITTISYELLQTVYQYNKKGLEHPFISYLVQDIKPNSRVLEIGCGRGWLSALLSKNNQVDAVDISDVNLTYCRENHSAVNFYKTFAEELPFEDDTYDSVIMFDVIEHCLDVDRVVREASRVLRSGGNLYIVTPQLYGQIYWNLIRNYRNTGRWFQLRRYSLYLLTGKLTGNLHFHEFTPDSIRCILRKCDFQVKFVNFNKSENPIKSKVLKILSGRNYFHHTLYITATKNG